MRSAAQVSQSQISRKRLGFLLALAAIWVCIITGRLLQLQVLKHESYAESARRQQTREVPLLAPRGEILDREGKPLAVSLEHDSIAINPMRVPDPAAAAKLLAKTYGFNAGKLEEKIAQYKENRWGFLWIRRWASPEEAAAARRLQRDKETKADWIELYKEYKRHYPKRTLASHVVGSVGLDGYGQFGMEYHLNDLLAGEQGSAHVLHDVGQRGIESSVTKTPKPGMSVRLSIDQRIQSAAEQALKKAIRENNVPSGSVVVMNPYNGDLLAIANYPEFDPNQRPRRKADLENRINRAVSLIYEPGSVFKVITLAAGLEKTRLRPESIIDCGNGFIRLPGRTVRDHHSYSALPYSMVLAKSSNVGSINIASAVGKDAMYNYVRAFGFGERTGLELPFEEPGYVWPMHEIDKPRIYSNILASVAMGHQISATTVQLAQACSVIANGGTLVKPRILLETTAPDGVTERKPIRKGDRVLRPETAITMRRMMEGVMLEGTGKAARLAGWTAGGKTGTAQMFDLKQRRYLHVYHSSFMGFAPLQNPAVAIVVTLNESKSYGGVIAAPVFQEVASETLRILGIPMDNPATAMASAKSSVPKLEDVAEGDSGLVDALADVDKKLLPDSRRQLLSLLSSAIHDNPEIEDWMISSAASDLAADRAPSGTAAQDASSEPPVLDEQRLRSIFEAEAAASFTPAVGVAAPSGPQTVTVYTDLMEMPDFRGKSIREVMRLAMEAGITVEVYGRGISRKQIPPPGASVPKGKPVSVLFTP